MILVNWCFILKTSNAMQANKLRFSIVIGNFRSNNYFKINCFILLTLDFSSRNKTNQNVYVVLKEWIILNKCILSTTIGILMYPYRNVTYIPTKILLYTLCIGLGILSRIFPLIFWIANGEYCSSIHNFA